MVRRYYPLPILPGFTDAALTNSTDWGRAEADKLLTIPAEYRQACEVEVNRRTSRTEWNSGMPLLVDTGDPSAARSAVVAEILAQLAEDQ